MEGLDKAYSLTKPIPGQSLLCCVSYHFGVLLKNEATTSTPSTEERLLADTTGDRIIVDRSRKKLNGWTPNRCRSLCGQIRRAQDILSGLG